MIMNVIAEIIEEVYQVGIYTIFYIFMKAFYCINLMIFCRDVICIMHFLILFKNLLSWICIIL